MVAYMEFCGHGSSINEARLSALDELNSRLPSLRIINQDIISLTEERIVPRGKDECATVYLHMYYAP